MGKSNKAHQGGPMNSPLSAAVNQRDRDTMSMVKDAIARKQVLLAYQPIVQSIRPDRPAFYEGLLRVLDSTGRVIPAREFITTAETSELGRELDCLALEKGLQALAETPELRLAINMSARSIGYPKYKEVLNEGLTRAPSCAERLILEISESSAMLMPEIVSAFMSDLQIKGISFALDDFGSGATILKHFIDFDFDMIKIDGSFIQGIAHSPDNQVLTQAMISIARHFDMYTIAEFVESQDDANYLAAIGIDCMQGYLFGAATLHPDWSTQKKAG